MIKINHLCKTYNKGKTNELNVTSDISLELPSSGLVTFLGQSGSGKTTLLNIIGGLDKVDSGEITYFEEKFSKYKMKEIDKFRAQNVGYIFQNYNLFLDQTVEDNLEIALSLCDVTDPIEVKRRIEYTLKAVGLYKFRHKLAAALSGGQQQRVAIARALTKNARIIIADEPTGNLDSENSIEIMNILKKVSEKTLVLLVTHNENLAYAYANQVIRIADGKVVSFETINENRGLLNTDSNKVYLKDLEVTSSNGAVNTTIYKETNNELNLQIVERNGTYYIEADKPIQLLKDSNLKLIDAHYEKVTKVDISNFDYDTSWYQNKTNKRGQFFFKTFKNELKSYFVSRKKTKFFHLVFLLIGIIIACINILYVTSSTIDTSSFNTEYQSYAYMPAELSSDDSKNYQDMIKDGIDKGIIIDVFGYDSSLSHIKIDYSSFESTNFYINLNLYSQTALKNNDLVTGRNSTAIDEIVLGMGLANKILEKSKLNTYDEIMNNAHMFENYTIVGISKKLTNQAYSQKYEDTTLKATLTKEFEMLVTQNNFINFLVNDIEEFEQLEDSYKVSISNNYETSYAEKLDQVKLNQMISIIVIVVLTTIVVVYVYLSMRSKMINDIYTIGVYRALGMSRTKLYVKNGISTFILSSFTTLIGYILLSVIYGIIASKLDGLGVFLPNIWTNYMTYLMIFVLYLVSLVFGLLPIISLTQKTPSEIISKYDI